jgi:hypothetical protein
MFNGWGSQKLVTKTRMWEILCRVTYWALMEMLLHQAHMDTKNEVPSSWDVLQHWIVPNMYARSWLEKNWTCWESCLQIAIDAKAFCIVLYNSQLFDMSWKQLLKTIRFSQSLVPLELSLPRPQQCCVVIRRTLDGYQDGS